VKRCLLFVAAISAFAGSALAVGAAPPPTLPDGPDLSVMSLSASDFVGATVVSERYVAAEPGTVAVFERDFALRGRLIAASNDVWLYDSAAAAQSDLAAIRRALATAAGRAAFAKAYRAYVEAATGRRLKIGTLTFSRLASVRAGEFAFRFSITLGTNVGRFHVGASLMRTERAVGLIGLVAPPGRTVPGAEVLRVTQVQAGRFRSGLTITNLAAPVLTGQPVQGQALSADRGRWTGGPTGYTHQWNRCDGAGSNCVAIPGATGTTYTPTPEDAGHTVRVRVEARNGISSLMVDSLPTSAIA
jgi:hypothetical protein